MHTNITAFIRLVAENRIIVHTLVYNSLRFGLQELKYRFGFGKILNDIWTLNLLGANHCTVIPGSTIAIRTLKQTNTFLPAEP